MTTVVLFGAKTDYKIGRDLVKALSCNGGVLHIRDHCLHNAGRQTKYVLYECENAPELFLTGSVVIFKNEISRYSQMHIPLGMTAIVDSENAPALRMLKQQGVQTISCGMSSHDTLSLSSVSSDAAAVSLQRQIVCADGQTVEPCEIPVKMKNPMEKYALLSCCAVLLFSRGKEESGYIF